MVLAQLRTGEKVRIVEGKVVRVISSYGPMTVEVDRSIIAIGRGMARKVEVERC